jgi:hypothetical protein
VANILLHEKTKNHIEVNYLEGLLFYANLPDGVILLVFHENALPENNQGVCVAAQLIDIDREFKYICNCSGTTSWDCCVAIAKKWWASRAEFPAYFTYLLGHELGHAYVYLSDISLHIQCCLFRLCIRPASNNKISFPHELPNEMLFDQFGKYLSKELHGSEKLSDEIERLKKTADDIVVKYLEQINKLPPSRDFSGLRKTMIDFSGPYKDGLICCWKDVAAEAIETGNKSLTHLISDYEKLFE